MLRKVNKGLAFLFSRYPIRAAGWYFRPMRDLLQQQLSTVACDLVIMDGLWLCGYWPVLARSKAAKVLHFHDLESEALLRHASVLPPGPTKLLYLHDAARISRLEARVARGADLILVTSTREQNKLLQQYPGAPVKVAPNGVDCQTLTPLPEARGKEILFVGSLGVLPNIDAIRFFVRHVFPELRRRFSDLVFHIVGKNPPPEIQKLHGVAGINVAANVASVEPYYQRSALTVVPLRAGSGTRLKILESMALGRPVVSTSLGAEGIEVENNRHLLIADEPEALCHKITTLLTTPELVQRLVTEGRRLVEEKYSWTTIANDLFKHYDQLCVQRREADDAS